MDHAADLALSLSHVAEAPVRTVLLELTVSWCRLAMKGFPPADLELSGCLTSPKLQCLAQARAPAWSSVSE